MKTAYLGLGSNLGDRVKQLNSSIALLNGLRGTKVQKYSSVYHTKPIGYLGQPNFYNMVVQIATSHSPSELLHDILKIEQKLNRTRTIRWGPRTIDIDILLYEDQVYQSKDLQIPHPRMWERSFVMVPLLEIVDEKIKEKWSIEERRKQLSSVGEEILERREFHVSDRKCKTKK